MPESRERRPGQIGAGRGPGRAPAVVRNGDGRLVYALVQFDGPRPVGGLDRVVAMLTAAGDDDLTVLAWLTASKPAFSGRSPLEMLRAGDSDPVLHLAREWVGDAAR